MSSPTAAQLAMCQRYQASIVPVEAHSIVGIALRTLRMLPLNGLRHSPSGDTSGWFIWGGELSVDPGFFAPLHVEHLVEEAPTLMPYLAMGPGWRVLLAPDHQDVWYDEKLLGV